MVKVKLTLTRFITALILSSNGDTVTDMACVLLCYTIFLELLHTHESCFFEGSLCNHIDILSIFQGSEVCAVKYVLDFLSTSTS